MGLRLCGWSKSLAALTTWKLPQGAFVLCIEVLQAVHEAECSEMLEQFFITKRMSAASLFSQILIGEYA